VGVLVAVSIPIFTAQLKKARLATNQANARAAYAAAVAKELDATNASSAHTYKYDVATSTLTNETTAVSNGTTTAIADWKVDTKVGDVTLGDDQAATFTVTISEGSAASFTATKKTATTPAAGGSGTGTGTNP